MNELQIVVRACSYASAHRKEQQREYERAEREDKQHETV